MKCLSLAKNYSELISSSKLKTLRLVSCTGWGNETENSSGSPKAMQLRNSVSPKTTQLRNSGSPKTTQLRNRGSSRTTQL